MVQRFILFLHLNFDFLAIGSFQYLLTWASTFQVFLDMNSCKKDKKKLKDVHKWNLFLNAHNSNVYLSSLYDVQHEKWKRK